jgi:hypothetical protein
MGPDLSLRAKALTDSEEKTACWNPGDLMEAYNRPPRVVRMICYPRNDYFLK